MALKPVARLLLRSSIKEPELRWLTVSLFTMAGPVSGKLEGLNSLQSRRRCSTLPRLHRCFQRSFSLAEMDQWKQEAVDVCGRWSQMWRLHTRCGAWPNLVNNKVLGLPSNQHLTPTATDSGIHHWLQNPKTLTLGSGTVTTL